MIIRGYVYSSSVLHDTEIHLRSLVWGMNMLARIQVCTELDAQSEQRISKSSAGTAYRLTTCPDCLLDNYVVKSEHRKSCCWKTSVQSSQKMGFANITPQ